MILKKQTKSESEVKNNSSAASQNPRHTKDGTGTDDKVNSAAETSEDQGNEPKEK